MGFNNKSVKRVALLVMLIASSVPAVPESDPTVGATIQESRAEKMTEYRLPNNVVPRMYNIHIEPNMDHDNFTWVGKMSIDVQVVAPTSLLTLHAYKNLAIDESFTELADANGTKWTPIKHKRDNVLEFLKLQFNNKIPTGNYSLNLKYEGSDTRDFIGFYKASSRFRDTGAVAGTHFEATTARRAFPCWDEPGLKARFRLSVKHFSNYTAISNMPEIEHAETPDGKILTTFGATPIMSTYLLTFVVSDYQNISNEHRNVSLHTSKLSSKGVEHLLDLSSKVVEVMESYTGLPFGLPRIGSVVLPVYTSSATEHWGLVAYWEGAIRINATLDTTSRKDSADMLIAHELSHSWFGNRVTPLWWDDLWLSEAFATYFQYYIMDEIYENWGGVELFVVRNNQEAAFPDDSDSNPPVKWTPITNAEIRYLFGSITYRKGSAIVHMFRNVFGDNVFRAGIQKFMTKYSFKAAVADDLMAAFQEAYDEDLTERNKPLNVKETMTPWLVQEGYPIVTVTRNYTTGDTEVSQKSTLLGSNTTKWWIPLTYATRSSPNFSSTLPAGWISDGEDRARIDGVDRDDWILLNVRASGYYRVNYDDENWKRLVDYLNSDNYKNIHVLNRAQLINDAFYLAERDPQRYIDNFSKLVNYLTRELEYLPWRSAYSAIKSTEDLLRHTGLQKTFERRILELMHSFIENVGFEVHDTDDHFTKLSRTDIIAWACIHGHSGCSEYALQKLVKLAEDPARNQLHPDTTFWTFCAGLRGLNVTAAMQFASWAYEHERNTLIMTVDCTENHEIQRNILNASLTKLDADDPFETRMIFTTLLKSTEDNFNFAVDFFLENHQAMNDSNKNERIYAAEDIVTDIAVMVRTKSELEKLKQVLQLDAIVEDLNISVTSLLEIAERHVAAGEASAALYLKLWDNQLAADNSADGSRTESP